MTAQHAQFGAKGNCVSSTVVVCSCRTTRLERFTFFMSEVVAFLYTDKAIYFDYTEQFERAANIHTLILSFVFDSRWQL